MNEDDRYWARVALPATEIAPELACALLRRLMYGWEIRRRHADAVLLLSDLVTNAITEAAGKRTLELEIAGSGRHLRVAVADSSTVRTLRAAGRRNGHDPGMDMVVALADSWGAEDHHGGKRVWFELDLETA